MYTLFLCCFFLIHSCISAFIYLFIYLVMILMFFFYFRFDSFEVASFIPTNLKPDVLLNASDWWRGNHRKTARVQVTSEEAV